MNKTIFFFAITCWLLSLAIHVCSIAGIDILSKLPYVWLMHGGLFVAFIPAVLKLRKNEAFHRYISTGDRKNPFDFLKAISGNAPKWLWAAAGLCFVYAIFNFMYFFVYVPNSVQEVEGIYMLTNHGKVLRVISQQEYHAIQAATLRGFSGHWLAFYALSIAILYPLNKIDTAEN